MDIPRTTHPHLASIGQSLTKSMQRHLVENETVRSAFAELAFELDLARHVEAPVVRAELLESTA